MWRSSPLQVSHKTAIRCCDVSKLGVEFHANLEGVSPRRLEQGLAVFLDAGVPFDNQRRFFT